MQGLSQQIEQAAAVDNFDKATALQSELDTANSESSLLASEHGFSSQDAEDLMTTRSVTAPAQPTLAAEAVGDAQLVKSAAASKTKISQGPRSSDSSASNLEDCSDPDAQTLILPEHLIGNGHISATKVQLSSSELSAAVLNRRAAQEEDDSEDADQEGLLVGDSSSVISASHAATDGSRSVQSSRTVLDKMPEFNMDDAVSFR